MPLFHVDAQNEARRISSGQFPLERQLQNIVEANLNEIFGVRFVASEFVIRGEQPGRIDTLGLDWEGAPTIVEYKRAENENVINQGLYYMNWLVEHRGDFELAAQRRLGHDVEVDWSHPRLIIIAQNYAKWDTYAVNRMGDGIELWRYTLYGDDLLYLELVFGQQRTVVTPSGGPSSVSGAETEPTYTLEYHLEKGSEQIGSLFQTLREGILALAGEEGEILETPNKLYISYRHGKNFCEVQFQLRSLKLHLDIPFALLDDPQRLARDVSGVGHWGTGDVEVKVESEEEIPYVLELVKQSYQQTI
jgi:predicted transport protein